MSSRIIVMGKNRDFSVFGMPATPGGARGRAEGSSAPSRQELPTDSGVQPDSEATAEPSCSFLLQPEAAPAVSGARRACRTCGGCGWNYDDYICPLSYVWTKDRVTCSHCGGDGYEVAL